MSKDFKDAAVCRTISETECALESFIALIQLTIVIVIIVVITVVLVILVTAQQITDQT